MRVRSVIALAVLLGALGWRWYTGRQPFGPRAPEREPAAAAPAPSGADAALPAATDSGSASAPAPARREVRVVEEETGAAIPGARVVLLTSSAVVVDAPFIAAEWRADERGVVSVELDGDGALRATAEGYVWSPAVEGAELAAPVVTLRCRRGALVQGRVVDAKGAPLAGVEVTAENTSLRVPRDRAPRHTFSRTRTDAEGEFRASVHDGEVLVRAGSGLWRVTEQRALVPAAPLRLVLEPGFGVRGQVFGADGGVAAFAEVSFGWVRPIAADEGGRFEIGALEEPTVRLEAASDDGEERSREREVRLKVGAWTEVELRLARTLRVEGMVKDAAGRAVPGAFLAGEPLSDDEDDGLSMTVADWTAGSPLRSGPNGEFSIDSKGLDPKVTLEILGWVRGAEGSARAKAGQRVELVLRETPMVTGAVTGLDGRALTRFTLSGAAVDSADGTFAVARSALDEELVVGAPGHQAVTLPLPEGGVDLGRVGLAQVHRVQLELTVEGRRPRDVGIDGVDLLPGRDGGFEFDARLPFQEIWLHGSEFVSRRVEVGGNDQVVRLQLSTGGKLLVRTEPSVDSSAWFKLEDCAPPRSPFDRQRYARPEGGGLMLAGLTAGSCRLVLDNELWQGSAKVELPAAGVAEATMAVTRKATAPGQMILRHIRGSPPGRPHKRAGSRAEP